MTDKALADMLTQQRVVPVLVVTSNAAGVQTIDTCTAFLKLPGSRRRCTITGLEPEGDNCPLCHGSMKVTAYHYLRGRWR